MPQKQSSKYLRFWKSYREIEALHVRKSYAGYKMFKFGFNILYLAYDFCTFAVHGSFPTNKYTNSFLANQPAHPLALKTSLLCLMTASPLNSFLFGIRNNSIQMVLINFMRKEFYKNEVQQEIRLRSPALANSSKRPSMTSIVGHLTGQVPYLQRQVSMANLSAVSNLFFQAEHVLYTPGLDENRGSSDFIHHSTEWVGKKYFSKYWFCERR